jgi:hypothetical protein
MSLGRLLTTGKSLVGLHGTHGRYQLRTGALPKFESCKNPFAKAQAEPEPQLPKLSPAKIEAANLKKTQPLPVLGEVREAPKVSLETCEEARATAGMKAKEAARADARPAVAVDSWVKKLNPMVWLQNRKPAGPKPAAQRFSGSKTPVQGELSLDNIRVMRNDLSEADLEVAPAKARPAKTTPAAVPAAGAAAAAAAPELPSAKRALDYLNERLMGKH